MGRGERPANLVERLEVCDRVRSSRPADRALVEEDRVFDLVGNGQLGERGRRQGLAKQLLAQGGVKGLFDERALAGPAYPGDHAEDAQRKRNVDRLQVVAPSPCQGQRPPGGLSPGGRNLDPLSPGKEIAGERAAGLEE